MSDVDPLGNRPADYMPPVVVDPLSTGSGPAVPRGTWRALVMQVAGEFGRNDLTDDDCDWLLWERTAFPFVGADEVRTQLVAYFTDPAAADALAEAES